MTATKNVLHATRSSNGTDGFLRYLHDDAEHIIREGHNPNVWVSYVHFHDGGDVPDLREAGRHGFFDRVLDTIRRSGGECRYTANMRDVLFCIEQDIVPLTPAAERTLLMAGRIIPLSKRRWRGVTRARMPLSPNTAPTMHWNPGRE